MARAVCSSAPPSGVAPFLRTCRLGRGLVCRVSAVSRGRSPGNCFPQLGPQLFVITGETVTSRSCSSPILKATAQRKQQIHLVEIWRVGRVEDQCVRGVGSKPISAFCLGKISTAFCALPVARLPHARKSCT
jgi:hypothetical protein